MAETTAGSWVGIYWGSLTVGRLVLGFITGIFPLRQLLRLCIIGVIVGAALIWLNIGVWATFLGFVLAGLALAPIFPSMISVTPERLGPAHTANGVGFQVAAAALGGALLPSLFGVIAGAAGLELLGPFLLASAAVLLVLYESVMR